MMVLAFVHALANSRLDLHSVQGCNALYVELCWRLFQILQLVQNGVAMLLVWANGCQYITLCLGDLHWLSICYWANVTISVLT